MSNKFSVELYSIDLKNQLPGEMLYGRKKYDFQEGSLMMMSPGQLLEFTSNSNQNETRGWGLFFHPDLLLKSSLSKTIDDYNFFYYELNESLHVSEREKQILTDTIKRIDIELSDNIDSTSQLLIISNIELLLNYCKRFYNRQFITRSNFDGNYISDFKQMLKDYFREEKQKELGLPTVAYFAEKLNLSPKYFSDLVKMETEKNALSHLHDYIIKLAKTKIANSNDSINEIAYFLGFDYPQYFSKLFKQKTGSSPVEFRTNK